MSVSCTHLYMRRKHGGLKIKKRNLIKKKIVKKNNHLFILVKSREKMRQKGSQHHPDFNQFSFFYEKKVKLKLNCTILLFPNALSKRQKRASKY